MKWVHISFHFEFAEDIEELLDGHEVPDFVRYPMIQGKDEDGKHFGNKIFPGNMTVVQAQVPDETVDDLLDALKRFKEEKVAHRHLTALVLPVERRV
jgi:hypothetical protein